MRLLSGRPRIWPPANANKQVNVPIMKRLPHQCLASRRWETGVSGGRPTATARDYWPPLALQPGVIPRPVRGIARDAGGYFWYYSKGTTTSWPFPAAPDSQAGRSATNRPVIGPFKPSRHPTVGFRRSDQRRATVSIKYRQHIPLVLPSAVSTQDMDSSVSGSRRALIEQCSHPVFHDD